MALDVQFSGSCSPYMGISIRLLITVVVTRVVFFVFALSFALRAQRRRITTGMKGLIGEIGSATTDLSPKGRVFVRGEYWNALSCEGVIKKGEEIEVRDVERLKLKVRRKKPEEGGA
jgi:membrane-bound serine protease (ClpP class)